MYSSMIHIVSYISVICVLGCIGFIAIKSGYKKQVKDILFFLVVQAEKEFGSSVGKLKYAAVSTWLYNKIPVACRWLFTSREIRLLIEEAVENMKKWLSTNKEAAVQIQRG